MLAGQRALQALQLGVTQLDAFRSHSRYLTCSEMNMFMRTALLLWDKMRPDAAKPIPVSTSFTGPQGIFRSEYGIIAENIKTAMEAGNSNNVLL